MQDRIDRFLSFSESLQTHYIYLTRVKVFCYILQTVDMYKLQINSTWQLFVSATASLLHTASHSKCFGIYLRDRETKYVYARIWT